NRLDFSQLSKKQLKAKWYSFSSMMDSSFKAQVKLAKYVTSHGAKIAFNPSQYQVKEGVRVLKPLLDLTEILLFNKQEAFILTKTDDIFLAIKTLHTLGIKIVVITDGPHDLYCSDKKHIYSVRPPDCEVVEATGAGDAFSSAFVATYVQKKSVEDAIKAGLANSLSVLTHFGAKKNLLRSHQIEKHIAKYNITIKKR
ncbi:MAG: carbohydrate kinase family protein, partial [Candidatus Woesearchaeota archaeon]